MRILAAALLALTLAFPAKAVPLEARMVEAAPGVALRVVTAGAESAKPTLVLIPGWSATADIWRAQIDAFSSDRRVLSLDPRSQGASTKTGFGDTPEQRAADLEAVLKASGVGRAVLVGWSQGVQDVAAYVERFGTARLAGVVLVDAPISPGAAGIAQAPQDTAEQFRMFAVYAAHPHEYLDGMFRAIVTRQIPEAERAQLVTVGEQTPPAIGVAQLVNDMFGPDRTGAIAKLDRPTLVIAAASSPELEAQKAMAAKLPQGRFETVPDASHAVFIDQPERFNALLRGFLDALPG